MNKGPPYLPTTWALGGRATKSVDIPITAVFLALYIGSAAWHMTIFQKNNKRGHKFVFNAVLFGTLEPQPTCPSIQLIPSNRLLHGPNSNLHPAHRQHLHPHKRQPRHRSRRLRRCSRAHRLHHQHTLVTAHFALFTSEAGLAPRDKDCLYRALCCDGTHACHEHHDGGAELLHAEAADQVH